MIRKSGEHLQFLWLVNLASLVCDVDRWLSGRVSALHSVVAGLISSGGDHGIYRWWDLLRSKLLSSVFVCHAQVFAGFSGHDNTIHKVICISTLIRRVYLTLTFRGSVSYPLFLTAPLVCKRGSILLCLLTLLVIIT